ncbi:beta-1,6-galactofuranosyltransferase [Limosilactobacillus sp.]|uniref:beta-1,6-galactofuranosyltransferase n=1 Tax=Limosilactobacillus sp. TaxID=2773925 RepID=UPI00345E7211
MQTYITNLNGLIGGNQEAQNMITDIACDDLNYRELGIYNYNWPNEPDEVLDNRIDGIIASLHNNDTVIFQFPTMSLSWDNRFINHVRAYDAHLIILIHDLPSQQGDNSDSQLLKQEIEFLNQADLIIAPSQKMVDLLNNNGLTVNRTVIMRMWDRPGVVNPNRKPKFNQVVSYLGDNPNQQFFRHWDSDKYTLQLFEDNPNWKQQGVSFAKPHQKQELIDNLRLSGGLSIVWDDTNEYYSLNPSYELSYYLAAGLPVIAPANISVADIIQKNNLGVLVDSKDAINSFLNELTEDKYNEYVSSVDYYSNSLRMGINTKLVLNEAIYQLFL